MKLVDEEEIRKREQKNKKLKIIIMLLILLFFILGVAISVAIYYISINPSEVKTYINGKEMKGFDKLLDFEKDENGNTQIYFPIKDMAVYFGYTSYNGEYMQTSEDSDKCYVVKEECEVAMYELNSKRIYTLDLEKKDGDYDYYDCDIKVFKNNDKLYTSEEGIENGYNVKITYDENKKMLKIYTMDDLISKYQSALENKTLGEYGIVEIDEDNYLNRRSVIDKNESMLIVKTENNKYGVISADNYSFILEPKYDNIEYIPYSSDFLVESNSKYGIISSQKKSKVPVVYDELTLMDRNTGLYRIKKDEYYGVIDEKNNIIINTEYSQIGMDVDDYTKNGMKNGYILLDDLIPVQQGGKLWGFYNIYGKKIKDCIYAEIGCIMKSSNIYSLLQIKDYDVVVVKNQNGKYTFMDSTGNDQILPALLENVFIQVNNGEIYYEFTYKNGTYNALSYLESKGVKSEKDN